MDNNDIMNELNSKLYEAGFPKMINKFTNEEYDPISIIINYDLFVKPYIHIFLDYAYRLEKRFQYYLGRAFAEKGLYEAVPFLISLYKNYDDSDNVDLWAIGNSLATIDDKDSYDDIYQICKDKKYGRARQMLFDILSKMKDRQDVYDFLIESLNDETVKAHTIEALGKFGNANVIPILENLEVKKGLYEFKAKEIALRKLNNKSS